MYVLALNTSTETSSVALLNDSELLIEMLVNSKKNHGETLLPSVESALCLSGVKIEDVGLFSLTVGPGSFTGLRVGVSSVKGLALGTSRPVVAVSSLMALAFNAQQTEVAVCPMIDARRREVYTALYRWNEQGALVDLISDRVADPELFLKSIKDRDVVFLGDGARRYDALIRQIMGDRGFVMSRFHENIRASSVGLLGLKKFNDGDILDAQAISANYIRPSYAEKS